MDAYRFKADTTELTGWLAKRKASLEAARLPHETVWKDLREHFEPDYGKALNRSSDNPDNDTAARDDGKILNSEPRTQLARMAAGMQGGITNPARSWFRLGVDNRTVSDSAAARDWLSRNTQAMETKIARSNAYTVFHQKYGHMGCFGNACSLLVRGEGNGIHLHIIDEGSYWIADNHRQRVTTLLRVKDFTADQMAEEFGEGWLPQKVKDARAAGKGEDRFEVWNLICPNDGSARFKDVNARKPFVSVYWMNGCGAEFNSGVLAVRPFSYNPILCPRWSLGSGVYGTGPGHVGLGDAKELQRLERDSLKVLASEADPAMAAPESMKGRPINTFPGGVTYYPDLSSGREAGPVTRLFETRMSVKDLEYKSEQVVNRLRRIFFADLFAMMLGLSQMPKEMTARQVNELASEKMALLGPVLTRMNQDLLDPFIEGVFTIMEENGEITPPPDILAGQELKVIYVSVLHTEQQSSSRLGSMFKLADFVGVVAPMSPSCVDKIDVDQAIDEAAESLAVPAGIIRDDKDVSALRQARAEQAQAQMQAEQAAKAVPGAARAVRDLGATRMGDGTALDAVAAGMAGGGGQS